MLEKVTRAFGQEPYAQKSSKTPNKVIVAKALDGQRYPLPLHEYVRMCDGERGSGPEGADDLCCCLGLEARFSASRLEFEYGG